MKQQNKKMGQALQWITLAVLWRLQRHQYASRRSSGFGGVCFGRSSKSDCSARGGHGRYGTQYPNPLRGYQPPRLKQRQPTDVLRFCRYADGKAARAGMLSR